MKTSGAQKRTSLKGSLKTAWIVLGATAIGVGLLSYSLVSALDYSRSLRFRTEELKSQATLIDRRISAEVIGGRTSVEKVVIDDLMSLYRLDSITQLDGKVPCPTETICTKKSGRQISVFIRSSETLGKEGHLEIKAQGPVFSDSFNAYHFVSLFIPIVALFVFGVFIQRRILNRSLIDPIGALVRNSYQGEEAPAQWPSEIAELSEKLDRAFRERDQAMIGQIASGVLHDMKTYLHGMALATDLVAETEAGQSRSNRLELLFRACSQQIPKMKAIIEGVLDGSRELRIRPEKSDLRKILESSLQNNADLAVQSDVEVRLDLPRELPIQADAVHLERAISNLVKNAIEACSEKARSGETSDSLKRLVRITGREASGAVHLAIEDQGPGLKQSGDRIFERLRTTKTRGTGLGLMVTKKIIDAHGGSISAERSGDLGGARFVMSLPLRTGG
ncbi:MAG: HAMP domain-containing histidine kinase [Bdellovibrionales bacterium]|nr:HAMP domain-containing histidine kinase [Bdellovibrionales bacterium]